MYIGDLNYIRIHHTGAGSYIDYTDGINFRNSGTTSLLILNSSNNQATFNYNLNTTGIINNTTELKNNSTLNQVGNATFSGTLTSTGLIQANYDIRVLSGYSLYVTNSGLTDYLRIHHSGTGGISVIDYTGGLFVRNSSTPETFKISTANEGTFNYNLNTTGITNISTNAIINNGILTQNGTCNLNSSLITSSSVYFNGQTQQASIIPTGNSTLARLSIHWNAMTTSGGRKNNIS